MMTWPHIERPCTSSPSRSHQHRRYTMSMSGGLKLFLHCWAQAVERVFGSVARVTRGWPGMLKPALGEVVEVIGVIIDRITRTRSGRGRLYSRYVVLAASRPDGTGLGAHEKLDGSCACLVSATGPRQSSNSLPRPGQQRFRWVSTCHAFWLQIADNSNYCMKHPGVILWRLPSGIIERMTGTS